MKSRVITILFLLLVLSVLVFIFFVLEKGEVKIIKKQNLLIGNFSYEDISFLSVYFRDYYDRSKEYSYILFKTNDNWYISFSNITDRVETKLGNFIANIIGDIENLGTIDSKEISDVYITFGFTKPNAKIVFDTRGKTNKMVVGNLTPTKDYYYVILNDDTNIVYLVYAYKIDNILKYPQEMRDRNIFTYVWTNVMGIEYKPINGELIVLTNKNRTWFSLVPFEKEVDTIFVETEFLRNLRSISIESFIDKDQRMYRTMISRTNSPISYIRLFNRGDEFLLIVITNILTNFYCYDPQRDLLFSIDYESTKNLFASGYEVFLKINK
ncbi:MAG: DUF4340 domain-containing protein [Brevinematia bacterium]